MNNYLLILGAGQYGSVAKETAQAMGCFDQIDFLDDASPEAVGKFSELDRFSGTYQNAFVAIGNPELRLTLIRRLQDLGFRLPVLIHPSAVVMPSAHLAQGTIAEAMAVVNSNAAVGTGCLICAGAVINHNAVLGDGCHIDCSAIVPARSIVPEKTKLPCGTVFK